MGCVWVWVGVWVGGVGGGGGVDTPNPNKKRNKLHENDVKEFGRRQPGMDKDNVPDLCHCCVHDLLSTPFCFGSSVSTFGDSSSRRSNLILIVSSKFRRLPPPWGTVDAEIKDPSVENPELKGSPF